jgi:5-methylcytosine-specific restriction endonuclease McrA
MQKEKPKRLGSKEKLRRFLLDNVGKVIQSDALFEASGGAMQYSRRIRELREEEGWPIKTHNDRNVLKPGEYLLEALPSEKKPYRFSRNISKRLRAQVLERNGYTCQMCGIGAGDPDPNNQNRPTRLHVSHVIDKESGGQDTPSNLKAFCSTCNQGAQSLVQEPPSKIWLLSQLRRANVEDQEAALNWLKSKFREN